METKHTYSLITDKIKITTYTKEGEEEYKVTGLDLFRPSNIHAVHIYKNWCFDGGDELTFSISDGIKFISISQMKISLVYELLKIVEEMMG